MLKVEKSAGVFVVLACGGRDYENQRRVDYALDELYVVRPINLLMTGAYKGADTLALRWAWKRCVPFMGVPADWAKYGDKAGPIRNQAMLDIILPNVCMAFPGGRGTEDMMLKCKKLRTCTVVEVPDEMPFG